MVLRKAEQRLSEEVAINTDASSVCHVADSASVRDLVAEAVKAFGWLGEWVAHYRNVFLVQSR